MNRFLKTRLLAFQLVAEKAVQISILKENLTVKSCDFANHL
ncbi:hypothetical protein VP96_03679 [Vibrio cholerae]|nr:hypothetical protein VP96_03679 [Vibrio cholerae]